MLIPINNTEHVFRLYYSQLCIYAMHFVGDIDQAEDIVMDSFVRYVELKNDGMKIDSQKSYLYRMVRNCCISFLRSQRSMESADELLDMAPDEDSSFEQYERDARLWKEIDRLPPSCRKVFLMSKRDGMKYEEIATALSISVKTVEAHIGRAYTQLRGKAKEIYGNFILLFLTI
ncbi:MAG: RNA polymerase sigma-70 factor [Paludibacteraceae bacterium]|nr:RNA polymerase sigma-70 factor [Paludibacteraceae bacterium]